MDQFRTFDLADRKQNVLNGRVDYALHPNVDGAVSFQVKDAEYLAQYGRTGHQRANSATLDLNWQTGASTVLYGYYAYQGATMAQKGVHPLSCIIGTTYYFYSDGRVLTAATGATPPATPAGTTLLSTQAVTGGNWNNVCSAASPTSPQFPESRGWSVDSRDRNDTFGAGVKYDFGKVRVDATFSRILSRTQIGYTYNAAALGLSATQAALAGTGLSDLTFAQNVFEANVLVPIDKKLTMRFLVRHETGKVNDWHYDGVAANPMPTNNTLYLDAGPQPWKATLVGILFQVRL
jgi:predicted porin